MSKTPEMETTLRNMFPSRKNMDERKCVICNLPVLHFRDQLSAKEYSISGLCQDCQDTVFGEDDEY